MNKLRLYSIILIGAGLSACSSFFYTKHSGLSIPIQIDAEQEEGVERLLSPYRDSLQEQMSEVIAVSEISMTKKRPCSPLNNWVVDALWTNQVSEPQTLPTLALLNVGGLRSSINQGNVTLGDLFTLMPFDNRVVWLKLPMKCLDNIAEYIQKKGGEPIANATYRNGKVVLKDDHASENFWLITTDYLANGGDNMAFLKEQTLERKDKPVLLREVLITEAKKQKTLIVNHECRIELE